MTIQQMKATGKLYGFTVKHNHWDREFRVNVIGGTEATAYYTDDRQDAVDTGIAMRRHSWQYEVANGDTVLGFAEWIEHQKEAR